MMKSDKNRKKITILCQNRHCAYQNSNYNIKHATNTIALTIPYNAH